MNFRNISKNLNCSVIRHEMQKNFNCLFYFKVFQAFLSFRKLYQNKQEHNNNYTEIDTIRL